MAATEDADQKAEIQDTKIAERHRPQFIPKLRGKKIVIRLVSGGQPITGTLESYNPLRDPHPDNEKAAPSVQARYRHNRNWVVGASRGKMPLESNGVGINSRRVHAESVVSAFQHPTYTTRNCGRTKRIQGRYLGARDMPNKLLPSQKEAKKKGWWQFWRRRD